MSLINSARYSLKIAMRPAIQRAKWNIECRIAGQIQSVRNSFMTFSEGIGSASLARAEQRAAQPQRAMRSDIARVASSPASNTAPMQEVQTLPRLDTKSEENLADLIRSLPAWQETPNVKLIQALAQQKTDDLNALKQQIEQLPDWKDSYRDIAARRTP
ncbi:hypothetical protein WJ60_06435 [Burkholderia ubonensis]|uniref:hypothetical protein n=1 Tax=Burkholderia ubonensis TaxID=101571 RepID=UPI00075208D5|nr:hypothetical protein [Burkholderia ubonensis]KVM73943.1 hypothetical protein WJ60_06435 [Burkholderia ubonensis]